MNFICWCESKFCREAIGDIAGWKETNWCAPIFWSIWYGFPVPAYVMQVCLLLHRSFCSAESRRGVSIMPCSYTFHLFLIIWRSLFWAHSLTKLFRCSHFVQVLKLCAFFRLLAACNFVISTECTFLNIGKTANVVLEGALERITVGELYCDLPLGLYIIRGENVVLIGELVRLFWSCIAAILHDIFTPTTVSSWFITSAS